MPLSPLLMMPSLPQQLTNLISRIPGYIYLCLAIPILGEVPTRAQYIGGIVILLGLFLGRVGIKARTELGFSAMETEQEIEARMGFRGI
jgi:drug/metabolite transporter (DMT)-like permease